MFSTNKSVKNNLFSLTCDINHLFEFRTQYYVIYTMRWLIIRLLKSLMFSVLSRKPLCRENRGIITITSA